MRLAFKTPVLFPHHADEVFASLGAPSGSFYGQLSRRDIRLIEVGLLWLMVVLSSVSGISSGLVACGSSEFSDWEG